MEIETIAQILFTAMVTVVAFVASTKWSKFKMKFHAVAVMLDAVAEAAKEVDEALTDDKISDSEYEGIVAKLVAVVNSAKKVKEDC